MNNKDNKVNLGSSVYVERIMEDRNPVVNEYMRIESVKPSADEYTIIEVDGDNFTAKDINSSFKLEFGQDFIAKTKYGNVYKAYLSEHDYWLTIDVNVKKFHMYKDMNEIIKNLDYDKMVEAEELLKMIAER